MKRTILFLLLLLSSIESFAYAFSAVSPSGHTLYYDFVGISNSNVKVSGPSYSLAGDLVIPSTVTYNGNTYSVTSIADCAFNFCSGLTSVTIPNSVTSIGIIAFQYCSGLTSVTIGNSVTSIGDHAFEHCSGLTSVTIPNSVTSIGDYAFWGCSGLTSIVVETGNTHYDSRNNCNAIIETGTNTLICGCMNTTIPNSVTSIGKSAFEYCSNLTSVTIPNSVTTIGDYAFAGCSGLTSIVVETGNTHYDSRNNCNAIIETGTNTLICGCMNTTIPNSVTSIGDYAFYGCSSLTSVTIPNSVTSIGDYAFEHCSGLMSVTIPNSVTSIGKSAFEYCSNLTSVTIPNSVTSIGGAAFAFCTGLTSVTIPNSVTSIGGYAFNGCSGLTSVTIPNSVTSIGWRTFEGCSGLTSVTIPNSVTSIGDAAFGGCSGLTSVTIPNSVTSIGDAAFSGCSGLTSIIVESGNTHYDSRNNCNAIIETGTNTLICGCMNTTIPNSVTTIGDYAFAGCSGLTSMTIPNSVTSIGDYAFYGCSSLTEITSEARTAPELGSDVFTVVNDQISVKIPCGSLASYMSRWSYFSNFVQDGEGFSFEATSNNPAMGYVTVLTQPTCSAPHAVVNAVANPGYRFVRWDNGVTDNPYALDLISDTALVAIFESASTQGVDDVMMNSCNITTRDGMIVVKGAEGELLRIFDIEGRVIVSEKIVEGKQYSMPHSGVYMVQVGNHPAEKVVVVR